MKRTIFSVALIAMFIALAIPALAQDETQAPMSQHAMAMHGAPKYAPNFTHFDYANPDAPKGGNFSSAAIGTFDTLNPFTLKGMAATGLGQIFDTLTVKSLDEPFTEYGLLAKEMIVPEDRSFVTFVLRDEARFHDGTPVTAEDVIWTFNILREKGHPFYGAYYGAVEKVENIDGAVKFSFAKAGNRELPLIIGQMPVLPKHFWEGKDFAATTLEPVLGSGPYRIKTVETGRRIVYERVKDYWAADLPVNRGQNNFDTITVEYFRDANVALEALFSGAYDFRHENVAKNWALAYDVKPVREGLIVKDTIDHNNPTGMQAFVFNTRRDIFADKRVRRAIMHAFDFEWSNKQFAFDAYTRTTSYFSNSDMVATGLPSGKELEILEQYRDQLPSDVFEREYTVPKTDGSGNVRDNLRKAVELLKEAGYAMQDGQMVHQETGEALSFEIVEQSPMFERWILPFIQNLKKIGVTANLRLVDTAQYQNRIEGFDFDMTITVFAQSTSPGNEQYDYWGSEKADIRGSRNLIGVKDPVVDALIERIVHAESREDLVAATKALDRVLLWGHYVVPQWHISNYRLAYWDKFGMPETHPEYGLSPSTLWWFDREIAVGTTSTPSGE